MMTRKSVYKTPTQSRTTVHVDMQRQPATTCHCKSDGFEYARDYVSLHGSNHHIVIVSNGKVAWHGMGWELVSNQN